VGSADAGGRSSNSSSNGAWVNVGTIITLQANKIKRNSNVASSVGLITSGVANIGSTISTLTALEKYKKNNSIPQSYQPDSEINDGKYNDDQEREEEEPIYSSSSSSIPTPKEPNEQIEPILTTTKNVSKKSWRNVIGERTPSSIISPKISLNQKNSQDSIALPVNTKLSNNRTKRNSRYPVGLSEPRKNITLKKKKTQNKGPNKIKIESNNKSTNRVYKNILSPLESNTTYKKPQGKKRIVQPNKKQINKAFRNAEKNAEQQLIKRLENKKKAKENKRRIFKEKQEIEAAERKRQEEEAERQRQEEEAERKQQEENEKGRQEKIKIEEQLREIATTVQQRSSEIKQILEKAEEEENNTKRQVLMNSATMMIQSSKAKGNKASAIAEKYTNSKEIQAILQNIQNTTNVANNQIQQTRRKLGEKVGKLVDNYEKKLAKQQQQQIPKIKKGGKNKTKSSTILRNKQNTRKLRK
jgi:hypothetical protein